MFVTASSELLDELLQISFVRAKRNRSAAKFIEEFPKTDLGLRSRPPRGGFAPLVQLDCVRQDDLPQAPRDRPPKDDRSVESLSARDSIESSKFLLR